MELLCLASSHTTQIIQTVCKNVGIQLHSCSTTKEACQRIIEGTTRWIAVVTALGSNQDTNCWTLLETVKKHMHHSHMLSYTVIPHNVAVIQQLELNASKQAQEWLLVFHQRWK